ncbi:MAG: hypothetical protein WC527_09055 [Candidatus Margulisiibacteriota bacterium]
MFRKKQNKVIEVEPVDKSPRGLEELKFILDAVLAELNDFKTEEELKAYLKKELAKPDEELNRQTRAIIEDARRRFRAKKDS